jgi:hypothetical protein
MKSPRGFVWLPALLVILGILVVSGGTYWYVHSQKSTSQVSIVQLASTTVQTQSSTPVSQTVSVSGMSEYTDSNFGFSFWYPSSWTVSIDRSIPSGFYASLSGDTYQRLVLNDGGSQFYMYIDEVNSSNQSIDVPATEGTMGCVNAGGCNTLLYYFDAGVHAWMLTNPTHTGQSGKDGSEFSIATTTQLADVSQNTMGGLHMLSAGDKYGQIIIPLSADRFVVLIGEQAVNTPLAKTIVATDPSVATPVSAAQQVQVIQAEQQAYANQ